MLSVVLKVLLSVPEVETVRGSRRVECNGEGRALETDGVGWRHGVVEKLFVSCLKWSTLSLCRMGTE